MNKHKIIMMATLIAIGVFTAISGENITIAQSNQTPTESTQNTLSDLDKQFVTEATQGGLAEVELGQLASQRAVNNKVKQFGQQMVQDHTQANNELKQLAAQKGITIATELNEENSKLKANLSELSGAAFDQAYMKHMLEDHVKDVSLFQRQAEQGQDQDLKAWAAKTLPTLQQHLQTVRSITGEST